MNPSTSIGLRGRLADYAAWLRWSGALSSSFTWRVEAAERLGELLRSTGQEARA